MLLGKKKSLRSFSFLPNMLKKEKVGECSQKTTPPLFFAFGILALDAILHSSKDTQITKLPIAFSTLLL